MFNPSLPYVALACLLGCVVRLYCCNPHTVRPSTVAPHGWSQTPSQLVAANKQAFFTGGSQSPMGCALVDAQKTEEEAIAAAQEREATANHACEAL